MRLFALIVIVITLATPAYALSIIGAVEQGADDSELAVVLALARETFGSVVRDGIMDAEDLADEDFETNIVLVAKDTGIAITAPEGSQADSYLSYLRPWVEEYERSAQEPEKPSETFETSGCSESDMGIYEFGTTNGAKPGSSIIADYSDLCIGDTLIEYTCEGDAVVSTEHVCSEGCAVGACIRSSVGSPSGGACADWVWTREGFICERPGVPLETLIETIEPPAECAGCVSGERCLVFGDRTPDGRTCTGEGIVCLGCEADEGCILEGEAADGRSCRAGSLIDASSEPEPTQAEPGPLEPAEVEPVDALPETERRGLIAFIADFFSRLIGRS